jgi:periplasmic mercuric ion binding protein
VLRRILCAMAASAVMASAMAGTVTAVLSVPTMDCPVCPITVKRALTAVDGVRNASVNFEQRQATVSFDDAKTSVEALTQATRKAGYPSTIAGGHRP